MPILKSAQKALRASKKKAVINSRAKSKVKTALDALKAQPSAERLSSAFSAVDRAVKRKMLPPNRAARVKSQLSKLVAG